MRIYNVHAARRLVYLFNVHREIRPRSITLLRLRLYHVVSIDWAPTFTKRRFDPPRWSVLTVEYIYLAFSILQTSNSKSQTALIQPPIKLLLKTRSPPLSMKRPSAKRCQENLAMSEPSAHIELASKPQHPEVDTLSDRRRRAVARWHAFAMYEEARVWREDQEAERARQRSTEQQDSQESQDAQGDKTVSPRVRNVTDRTVALILLELT